MVLDKTWLRYQFVYFYLLMILTAWNKLGQFLLMSKATFRKYMAYSWICIIRYLQLRIQSQSKLFLVTTRSIHYYFYYYRRRLL